MSKSKTIYSKKREGLILASESTRRAKILKQIGLHFRVIPSNIDESKTRRTNPPTYAKLLARMKAEAVSSKVKTGIIMAADTIIVSNGRIIGKPKNKVDALKTLRSLNGKTHNVITGVCMINKQLGTETEASIKTKVKFRRVSDTLLKRYVKSGEPLGKAGSYAVQEKGAILIDYINGDFYNIAGMPLRYVCKILEKWGVL